MAQSVSTYLTFVPKINAKYVDTLQQNVNQFIRLMALGIDEFDSQSLIHSIQQITEQVFGTPLESNRLVYMTHALSAVHKISNLPVTLFESDGKTQKSKTSSLSALLLKTLNGNYHTVQAPCQDRHPKTGDCKHNTQFVSGTSDHIFSCDFHKYDSVSVHLVLACFHNTLWVIDNMCSDDLVKDLPLLTKASLLGLYHDIAKPLCVETYEFKEPITGFPAHAEVGCMLFQAHWNPLMNSLISNDDFMAVSTAILRHMCGYHGSEGTSNRYKRDLLLLEQPQVRDLLIVNRVGDHFGKLVDVSDVPNESIEHFLAEQKLFDQRMHPLNGCPFNLTDLLKRSKNKEGQIIAKPIVLYLIGTSGAGKSYFASMLEEKFPEQISLISRDVCIATVSCGVQQRLEGLDYQMMYRIYDAGKSLGKTLGQSKGKNQTQNPNPLHPAIIALITAQTQWNQYLVDKDRPFPQIKIYDPLTDPVPELGIDVNKLFETQIQQALSLQKLFVVIDTFMNCFPMAIESSVPQALSKYFRVHVHVQSYVECTTTSIAETLADQLKISGSYGLDFPMHPDGFKKGKKTFASLSAEIGTEGPLPKSTFKSRFRPHLVAGICTRTPDGGSIGYTETLNTLKRLTEMLDVSVTKPITEPVTEPVTEPITEPVTEPVTGLSDLVEQVTLS